MSERRKYRKFTSSRSSVLVLALGPDRRPREPLGFRRRAGQARRRLTASSETRRGKHRLRSLRDGQPRREPICGCPRAATNRAARALSLPRRRMAARASRREPPSEVSAATPAWVVDDSLGLVPWWGTSGQREGPGSGCASILAATSERSGRAVSQWQRRLHAPSVGLERHHDHESMREVKFAVLDQRPHAGGGTAVQLGA